MSRKWKPGDVAMRSDAQGTESLAVCVDSCPRHMAAAHWHTFRDGRMDWDTLDFNGVTYRPLVVIDPEDREQVERLVAILHDGDSWFGRGPNQPTHASLLQKALHEFADPKPQEVFEHFVLRSGVDTLKGGVLPTGQRSVCGKVWEPSNKTVSVGKCPDCAALVESGWAK